MRSSRRLTIVLSALAVCADTATAPPVRAAGLFEDKVLEEAVRAELKKTDKAPLKEADLKNLFILKARGKKAQKISSLKGLEKCQNLALLHVQGNAIKDVGPLAGLVNIQSLDLSGNQIKNVAPLAKLVKLQYLKLDDNQVEDVAPMSSLKKLMSLYLANNKIKNIKPLAGLVRLASLYLDDNQIKDISPLKGIAGLNSLGLKNNQIKDVSPLSNMTELRYTFLQGNAIADISTLSKMAEKDAAGQRRFAPYWHLYLASNPLSGASKGPLLAGMKKIGVRVDLTLK